MDKAKLAAYVYYTVQETEFYYYIQYAYFHPRDPKRLDRHENDFEGAMVIVQKDDERLGTNREGEADRQSLGGPSPSASRRVALVQTTAHNRFRYATPLPGELVAVENGELLFDPDIDIEKRTHPVIVIEPGRDRGDAVDFFAQIKFPFGGRFTQGHGASPGRLAELKRALGEAVGLIYVPGTLAETPDASRSTDSVEYKLISFTVDADGDRMPDSDVGPDSVGLWERHGIMEPVSGAYKSNVYLSQTNFERAVRTSPGQSNFECTTVDQMCNVCLGPVRGLPNDLGDELILNTESMCSEDAISFCRNYFEQKEITVP